MMRDRQTDTFVINEADDRVEQSTVDLGIEGLNH